MLTKILLLFLIIHVLGDFYFQGKNLAVEKNNKFIKLLLHGLEYFIVGQICIVPLWSLKMVVIISILSLIHLIIDIIQHIIYRISKSGDGKLSAYLKAKIEKGYVYILDQIVHILLIIIIAYIFRKTDLDISLKNFIILKDFMFKELLELILMFLLIFNPVNITFKKLFSGFKPEIEGESETRNNSGTIIGNLERALMLILMIMNQITAIGLIFTAKSISRYDKISKDKEFAEYYLLGTLFSILSTIIIYLTIFKI